MSSLAEVELIRKILQNVNTNLTAEKILSTSLHMIMDTYKFLACSIILVEAERNWFKVAISRGWSHEFVKSFHHKSMDGLVFDSLNSHDPILVRPGDARYLSEGYTFEHQYKSMLALPMGIRGKRVGIFYASSSDPDDFGPEKVSTLSDLANICTLVIDHGSLGDQVVTLSNYDNLTNLYSYKYWHEELHREVMRSDKMGSDLSLVEVYLNKFKDYNSMHGHIKGDELLVDVSTIIKGAVGELDIPCREGSKWYIVLVGYDQKAARECAEKILEGINELGTIGDPAVSLCVGVSTYNPGEGEKELIRRVEKALSEARREGPNTCRTEWFTRPRERNS